MPITVRIAIAAFAVPLVVAAGTAGAQDPPAEVERQRARIEAQERALVEQQAALEAQNRELEARNRELERARREMERARRQLEESARDVARLSMPATLPNLQALTVIRDFDPAGRRAHLGVNVANDDAGARVIGVTPGSAAASAGIRVGDVIMAIDGTDLTDEDRPATVVLIDEIEDHDPGDTVTVLLSRDGGQQELSLGVPLDEGPPAGAYRFLHRLGQGGMPEVVTSGGPIDFTLPFGFLGPRWRGMELVTLSEGLAPYFGTSEGLLVVRAPENGEIGLQDGDVILEIGERTPTSPEHAMRILTSFAPGETLELSIMRRQRRETIEYEIPEPGN